METVRNVKLTKHFVLTDGDCDRSGARVLRSGREGNSRKEVEEGGDYHQRLFGVLVSVSFDSGTGDRTHGRLIRQLSLSSGCVTSAESVLVAMQSHEEVYRVLNERPVSDFFLQKKEQGPLSVDSPPSPAGSLPNLVNSAPKSGESSRAT